MVAFNLASKNVTLNGTPSSFEDIDPAKIWRSLVKAISL
jgi:hypothetical protein